jgi:hypothetical protein
MTTFAIKHTRMAHMALRIPSSSDLPVPPAQAAPCVLDLLGHEHPRMNATTKAAI